jgi:hypothetical protein
MNRLSPVRDEAGPSPTYRRMAPDENEGTTPPTTSTGPTSVTSRLKWLQSKAADSKPLPYTMV